MKRHAFGLTVSIVSAVIITAGLMSARVPFFVAAVAGGVIGGLTGATLARGPR